MFLYVCCTLYMLLYTFLFIFTNFVVLGISKNEITPFVPNDSMFMCSTRTRIWPLNTWDLPYLQMQSSHTRIIYCKYFYKKGTQAWTEFAIQRINMTIDTNRVSFTNIINAKNAHTMNAESAYTMNAKNISTCSRFPYLIVVTNGCKPVQVHITSCQYDYKQTGK